jgi:Bacterial PH domain
MSSDDFDFEPIKGLPAQLPKGENILWQGAPTTAGLAVRAFHIRKIALYFSALMVWRMLAGQADGMSTSAALLYAATLLPMGLAAIGILWLIAWGYARTTVYTITNRRLMMRSGIAVPITVNLPFSRIDSASLKLFADGTGDIPLAVNKDDRIAVLVIWPHMRAWNWRDPQPMLRSVKNAARVAQIISAALKGEPVPSERALTRVETPGQVSLHTPGVQPA